MRLLISMIIAVSLIFCSVDHVVAKFCYGTEEEKRQCMEEEESKSEQGRALALLLIVGFSLFYVITKSPKTEQNETGITSEQLSKLLNKKTHEWVDQKGKLIIYRW